MKERPIIFNDAMVRAILEGRKTQTRRPVKVMRDPDFGCELSPGEIAAEVNGMTCRIAGPYGVVGDRLWVRETWDFLPDGEKTEPRAAIIRYWAGNGCERRTAPSGFDPIIYSYERKRPSIHMPRWASRITLEITGVRVERRQDISEADARAEGAYRATPVADGYVADECGTFSAGFEALWESIYGAESRDANQLVWVYEVKRIEQSKGSAA